MFKSSSKLKSITTIFVAALFCSQSIAAVAQIDRCDIALPQSGSGVPTAFGGSEKADTGNENKEDLTPSCHQTAANERAVISYDDKSDADLASAHCDDQCTCIHALSGHSVILVGSADLTPFQATTQLHHPQLDGAPRHRFSALLRPPISLA